MASVPRKLLPEPEHGPEPVHVPPPFKCPTNCSTNFLCEAECKSRCNVSCANLVPMHLPTSDNLPLSNESSETQQHLTSVIIISASSGLGVFLLAALCLLVFRKCITRADPGSENDDWPEFGDETEEEDFEETHHHVWLINTVGLQESEIDLIAMCKYRAGDGLIEGTECSVCLSEFEEDESLRLLPKCSHAFHLPCIDPWLRSHKNCPLCRAPVVVDAKNKTSMSEPNSNNSTSVEENCEIGTTPGDACSGEGHQVGSSVSIDLSSGIGNEANTDNTQVKEEEKLNLEMAWKRKTETSSLLSSDMLRSSSLGSASFSQIGPVPMKRSCSSGRLLLSIPKQSRRHSSCSMFTM